MTPLFEGLWNDLRFALRLLRRTPGFTAAAVLSLALGIGATTAIFSVLDTVVIKALTVPDPTELYVAQVVQGSERSPRFSYPLVESARSTVAAQAELAAFSSIRRMLLTDAQHRVPMPADMGQVQLVSGEFFGVLRQLPQAGRLLTPDDNRTLGAHPIAVLSDGYWERRFGRSPDALSRPLYINGTAFTVVGVFGGTTSPDPGGPSSGSESTIAQVRTVTMLSANEPATPTSPPPAPEVAWAPRSCAEAAPPVISASSTTPFDVVVAP